MERAEAGANRIAKILSALLRRLRHDGVGHHLVVAWTITAAMYIATDYGLTQFIDSRFLIVMQRSLDEAPVDERLSSVAPVVFEISVDDYNNTRLFGASSPLNRTTLTTGLAALIDKNSEVNPKVIAIDIDLSPIPAVDQTSLDNLLDSALGHGVQIVLITPLMTTAANSRSWVVKRCENGVMFGFPYLPSEYGATIRHQASYPSLGVAVRDAVKRDPKADSESEDRRLVDRSEICRQLASTKLAIDRIESVLWNESREKASVPIDFSKRAPSLSFDLLLSPDESIKRRINRSIVFVGGGFDPRDKHVTGVGRRNGVDVHAAISMKTTQNAPHWKAYALELLVGTLTGWVLTILWAWHRAAAATYRQSLASNSATLPMSIVRLLGLPRWGLAIVCICLAATFLILFFSKEQLHSGTWLNPAPLVLGMLLDTWMGRQEHGMGERHGATALRGWRRWMSKPIVFPQAGIILVSLILLIHSLQHP